MSLHSADALGGTGRVDGASAPADRAPRLLSAAHYAAWRTQIEVFLTQRGVGDAVRKQRTDAEWDALVALDLQATDDEEATALAALGVNTTTVSTSNSSTSSAAAVTSVTLKAVTDSTRAAQRVVRGIVERSQRAYGHLYSALPDELRPQVAHLPQGFAYALWRWIEGKYQSKESDNVSALFAQWTALEQLEGETFDAYRARVNKLADLLANADERPSARMYMYTLLEKLQSHYKPVVLALHNGDTLKRMKDVTVPTQTKKALDIDYTEVSRMINAHERTEQRLSSAEGQPGNDIRAMSAQQQRSAPYDSSASSATHVNRRQKQTKAGTGRKRLPDYDDEGRPRCFNCDQYGHIGKECTQARKARQQQKQSAQSAVEQQQDAEDESREAEACGFALCAREVTLPDPTERAMTITTRASSQSSSSVSASAPKPAVAAAGAAVVKPMIEPKKKSYAAAVSSGTAPLRTAPAVAVPGPESRVPAAAAPKKQLTTNLGTMTLDKALSTTVWGIDTMASTHVSGNRSAFGTLHRQAAIGVKVANGDIVQVSQVGHVPLRVKSDEGRIFKTTMDSVWYSPEFSNNLLSWGRLWNEGWRLRSSKDGGDYLLTPKGTKVPLKMVNRVMTMNTGDLERVYASEVSGGACAPTESVNNIAASDSSRDATEREVMRAHAVLGHMRVDRMVLTYTSGKAVVDGLPTVTVAQIEANRSAVKACTACVRGRMKRKALSKSATSPGHRGLDRGSAPGEVLHMDTVHMIREHPDRAADRIKEYGLVIVDGYASTVYEAVCGTKDQIAREVLRIVRMVGTQLGRPVKRLHADGGSEFINQTVRDECKRAGTTIHFPPRHTAALNGIAEAAGGMMKDMTRSLLIAADAPYRVWRSAFHHAAYVWNRTKISERTGVTPYETMMKKKPSVKHVGVFGCDAWYHVEKRERTTFEPKGRECVYLGHDITQGCAKVYCLHTEQVLLRRDVRFSTTTFQHMRVLKGTCTIETMSGTSEERGASAATESNGVELTPPTSSSSSSSSSAPTEKVPTVSASDEESEQEYSIDRISGMRQQKHGTQYKVHWTGYTEPTWEWREQLADTAALEAFENQLMTSMAPRRSPRLNDATETAPVSEAENDDDIEDEAEPHVQMVMSAISAAGNSVTDETRRAVRAGVRVTHRRATPSAPASDEKWKASRQAEIDACVRQGVWEDVAIKDLPPHANVLPSKWVDKEKSDGRLKSRITPKGFKQRHGIDYFETFAATAMYKTLRLMLSLVALWDYEIVQMDVPEAFLNAPLPEEVFMQMPPGYERPGFVKRLLKALYGLCQSPRNWGILIHGFTKVDLQFQPTESDICLYFRRSRTGRLMLLYRFVDDFEGTYHTADRAEFMAVVEKLRVHFNIKVLPSTDSILGMRLTRDRAARTIKLDLESYIRAALDKYGLSDCNPAPTPMCVARSDASQQTESEQRPCDRQLYMEITGTVMYAACAVRPDIAFAAHRLASNMQAPTERDMVAAKRVLRYLSGTRTIGLVFGGRDDQVRSAAASESRGHNAQQVSVCAYADADWASDKTDRKSVTGWIAKLNGDLISWSSKKQRTVALSTCEAELYAEAAAIQC